MAREPKPDFERVMIALNCQEPDRVPLKFAKNWSQSKYSGKSAIRPALPPSIHWIGNQQFRSALSYYALYPDEINEKIARNEDITEAQVLKRFPFLSRRKVVTFL